MAKKELNYGAVFMVGKKFATRDLGTGEVTMFDTAIEAAGGEAPKVENAGDNGSGGSDNIELITEYIKEGEFGDLADVKVGKTNEALGIETSGKEIAEAWSIANPE